MSGQMNQLVADTRGAGAGGQPARQPTARTVGHAWIDMDQQFVMQRTAMRERIFQYMERKQSSTQQQQRLPNLAKQLEEILYTKFSKKNDYYNMMVGPVEPQVMFALKTFNAQSEQNRQNSQVARQTPSSFSTNMVLNHDGLCEQSASIPPTQKNNGDVHDRTD